MSKEHGATVIVIDGGGRGGVLVDKYARDPYVKRAIAIPGNDLMQMNTDKPVEIHPELKTTSIDQILEISMEAAKMGEVLVDVAQDNAVEAGLVDALQKKGIPTVGPTRAAGQIEWDKAWSREFGERQGLPQTSFQICLSEREGYEFIDSQEDQPWFVKGAFLAEGKGALPAKNIEEARRRIKEVVQLKNGAGKVFLVEKWLRGDDDSSGEEFSTYAFSDGKGYKMIGSAQDHKRVNNFDEGENTGGMGCSTPPLVLTSDLIQKVEGNILSKTFAGLAAEGRPYKGVIYLGGMAVKRKNELSPYVIEWNARWGDPEAQVIVPGLVNDLYEVGMVIAQGNLGNLELKTDGKARVVVAGASRGYPGNYDDVKGKQIYGIEEARKVEGVQVYGAGVKRVDGKDYAAGGRLFYMAGEGTTVIDARERAYEAMSRVHIEGNNLHYRTDIGWRDVERLRKGVA